MSTIVFRLNDVPEDEACAIRDLLMENNIEFYETSAGKWGFSVAAIWIKDDSLKERARSLIEEYQARRYTDMREHHERMEQEGQLDTFTKRLLANPMQVFIYIVLVILVIYLTVFPFLNI